MALSVSTQVNPVGSKLVVETSCNATADNNVTGASGKIYAIDVDNSANSADTAFLKIYDTAAPTVGTTAPDHIVRVLPTQRRQVVIPEGLDFTALSFACVKAGGTAGVTAPASPVIVRMVTS